jgi:hypothetical protein
MYKKGIERMLMVNGISQRKNGLRQTPNPRLFCALEVRLAVESFATLWGIR